MASITTEKLECRLERKLREEHDFLLNLSFTNTDRELFKAFVLAGKIAFMCNDRYSLAFDLRKAKHYYQHI